MSRLLKTQSYIDENSTPLASKVRILEKELAEKTKLLAETQKQYQSLLFEFESLKSCISSNNYNNINNSISTKTASFSINNDISSFSSFNENASNKFCFSQPLKQLRNVEGNVQNLTLLNLSLQSKVDQLKIDQHEWHDFANSIFRLIHEFVYFTKDFPDNDSEAQRFILLDLIQKLTKRCLSDIPNEKLVKKYRISKLKLKQVQMKCDKILQMLGEKGYDVSSFEQQLSMYQPSDKLLKKRKESYNFLYESDDNEINHNYDYDFNDYQKHKQICSSDSDDLNINFFGNDKCAFKNDVKKLSSITHNMKGYYKDYAQLIKNSKKKL